MQDKMIDRMIDSIKIRMARARAESVIGFKRGERRKNLEEKDKIEKQRELDSKKKRADFIGFLEKHGYEIAETEPDSRQKIIDGYLPIKVNTADKTYKQIWDVNLDILKAKYGTVVMFESSLDIKNHDFCRDIYAYECGRENNEDILSKLQEIIIKYDTRILESAESIMEVSFFDNNIGLAGMSDLNMTLERFINSCDAGFREDFLSVYPNGASDIEHDIVFFDDNNAALYYGPKVYINVHEISENSFDVCLYVKDYMKDVDGNPKVYCGTYDNNCQS